MELLLSSSSTNRLINVVATRYYSFFFLQSLSTEGYPKFGYILLIVFPILHVVVVTVAMRVSRIFIIFFVVIFVVINENTAATAVFLIKIVIDRVVVVVLVVFVTAANDDL